MTTFKKAIPVFLVSSFLLLLANARQKQNADSTADSSQRAAENYIVNQWEQQKLDSLLIVQLRKELLEAGNDDRTKKELEARIHQLATNDSIHRAEHRQRIAELKRTAVGYPVTL